jgi:hypothetical protein
VKNHGRHEDGRPRALFCALSSNVFSSVNFSVDIDIINSRNVFVNAVIVAKSGGKRQRFAFSDIAGRRA